jgi:hypothetical protein
MQSCRQPDWPGPTATDMLRGPPYIISNAYPVHVGQCGSNKSSQLSWSSLVCFLFLHCRRCLSRPVTASGEPPCVHARFFCPSALTKVVVANKNLRISIGRAWPLACDVRVWSCRPGLMVRRHDLQRMSSPLVSLCGYTGLLYCRGVLRRRRCKSSIRLRLHVQVRKFATPAAGMGHGVQSYRTPEICTPVSRAHLHTWYRQYCKSLPTISRKWKVF